MLNGRWQATKDALQVAEVQASEACAELEREVRLRKRAEAQAGVWKKRAGEAGDRAMDSGDRARVESEKAKAMEREARASAFQNLVLQRKLTLLGDAVPRAELEQQRAHFEARLAEQADRLAELQADADARDTRDREIEEEGE